MIWSSFQLGFRPRCAFFFLLWRSTFHFPRLSQPHSLFQSCQSKLAQSGHLCKIHPEKSQEPTANINQHFCLPPIPPFLRFFSAIEHSNRTHTLLPQAMHKYFVSLFQIMQADGKLFLHNDIVQQLAKNARRRLCACDTSETFHESYYKSTMATGWMG